MPFNILDAAKKHLTTQFISEAAYFFEESEAGINKAISALMPVILSGLVTKANLSADNASDILDIVNDARKNEILDKMSDYLSNERTLNKNLTLERAIFGDKLNALNEFVASFAQIKSASVNSLFSIIAQLVAAISGKYSTEMNLSATSFASFLHGQRTNILSALPAELSNVARLLGLTNIGSDRVQADLELKTKYTDHPLYNAKKNSDWRLLFFLLLILTGLAVWYFAEKRHQDNKQTARTSAIKVALKICSDNLHQRFT